LSKNREEGLIRLALNIEDRALADRLVALLTNVPGLQLVGAGEPADILATEAPASADRNFLLTPRELEVLTLLAEGMSNKAVARRLGISVHTAKFHVGAVIDKLDVSLEG
jgi:DNA-binding CsgD family transcriptional regulator